MGHRYRRWEGRTVLPILLASLAAGCDGDVPGVPDSGLHATIHTNRGDILVRLEPERAPLATASFVGLAEGTIDNDAFPPGRPFYDGSSFHRVVPGHVIQAGAPDSERAGGPGYTFPNEIHAGLSHDRAGMLGVANGGPHTNGSQFYITLGDRSYLDGMYIVFGEVLAGMDVVRAIEQDDRVDSVRVIRHGGEAAAFRPDTESFAAMRREAEARVAATVQERARAQEAWLAANLPALVGERGGIRMSTEEEAAGPAIPSSDTARAPGPMSPVVVRYAGTALVYRGHLLGHEGNAIEALEFASGPDGTPGFHDAPVEFRFPADEVSLPSGLESLVTRMQPGDRVRAVVPADLAYGRSGYFAPERPGTPRFVIPPETMLVVEVWVRAP